MRQGHIERLIWNFLEEPANEQILLEMYSPKRKPDATHHKASEFHKTRLILSRMIEKGWIEKRGNSYYRKEGVL